MDPLWVSLGSCCLCQAPLERGAVPFSRSWETSSKSVQPLPLSEASERCNQERNALLGWAGLAPVGFKGTGQGTSGSCSGPRGVRVKNPMLVS